MLTTARVPFGDTAISCGPSPVGNVASTRPEGSSRIESVESALLATSKRGVVGRGSGGGEPGLPECECVPSVPCAPLHAISDATATATGFVIGAILSHSYASSTTNVGFLACDSRDARDSRVGSRA